MPAGYAPAFAPAFRNFNYLGYPAPAAPAQPYAPYPVLAASQPYASYLPYSGYMPYGGAFDGAYRSYGYPGYGYLHPGFGYGYPPQGRNTLFFTKPNLHSINSSKTLSSQVCSFLFLLRLAD